MPFVSQAQRAACYAQASRDRKAGRTPKWDCKKYEKHSRKLRSRKTKKQTTRSKRVTKRSRRKPKSQRR